MNSPILEVLDLKKTFINRSVFSRNKNRETIIQDISFQLNEGECLGLIGENGAGKTTLLRMIYSLIEPDSGEILINRTSLLDDSMLKNNISYVSSNERSFFWRLTLYENLDFFYSIYGLNTDEKEEVINRVIEVVNLNSLRNKQIMFFSSGEKKRAMIARSIMKKPRVLLFDEVCNSLDIKNKESLINFVKDELIKKTKISVIWATHSLDELEGLCDKILWMHKGKVKKIIDIEEKKNLSNELLRKEILNV